MRTDLTILDFGAGWKARHALALRELGLNVVAHDFGKNFDPEVHDLHALNRVYDVVYASNVLNVHTTTNALMLTIAQIANSVRQSNGFALVNYPESPRKGMFTDEQMKSNLQSVFDEVVLYRPRVWKCRLPNWEQVSQIILSSHYTDEEKETANVRPNGAVGANAVIPRLIAWMFVKE